MRTKKATVEEIKQEYDTCSELALWFVIDGIGGFIWRMNHDMAHGRIEATPEIEQDLRSMHEQVTWAVARTTRFGVATPFKEDGKSPTDEYRRWYKWWSDYIKRTLSDAEWDELNGKLSRGEEVSSYRPEGDW